MYYKIVNKECTVYKKLYKLRTRERQIKEENEQAILEKTGLEFENYLGDGSQQSFRRVPQYHGFQFTTPEKVDLKIWKADELRDGIFVPNKKTKLGREMAEFLLNGLKGSNYNKVFDILKLPDLRRFRLPYIEIIEDEIIIYLGDDHEPKNENVIEITKREFNELLDIAKTKDAEHQSNSLTTPSGDTK